MIVPSQVNTKVKLMLHDQHCHTSYSGDSNASIEKYFQIANKNHCSYFVTTEHIEFNSVYNHQDWTVDYSSLKKDLKALGRLYPSVTPLLGIELGYRKDYIDKMHQMIASEPFDLINLSVHDNGYYDYYMKDSFQTIGIDQMLKIYFDNIIDALMNFSDFDVLSHFDYGFKTAYLLDKTVQLEDYKPQIERIFQLVIEKNKTLEVNVKVQDTIHDLNHTKQWLMWYKEQGGKKLTLSSDAHTEEASELYYQTRDTYIHLIQECGFDFLCYYVKREEKKYLLNTN